MQSASLSSERYFYLLATLSLSPPGGSSSGWGSRVKTLPFPPVLSLSPLVGLLGPHIHLHFGGVLATIPAMLWWMNIFFPSYDSNPDIIKTDTLVAPAHFSAGLAKKKMKILSTPSFMYENELHKFGFIWSVRVPHAPCVWVLNESDGFGQRNT